jgi:hypothetical protein
MNVQPAPVDIYSVRFAYDGSPERKSPPFGNYLGCYGVKAFGDGYWYYIAVNGDHGEAADEAECRRELEEAWWR